MGITTWCQSPWSCQTLNWRSWQRSSPGRAEKILIHPRDCLRGVRELVLRKCRPRVRIKCRRLLKSRPSAKSNASSPRSSWTWLIGLLGKNWIVKTATSSTQTDRPWLRRDACFHSRVPGYRGFRRIDRKLRIIFGSADRILDIDLAIFIA